MAQVEEGKEVDDQEIMNYIVDPYEAESKETDDQDFKSIQHLFEAESDYRPVTGYIEKVESVQQRNVALRLLEHVTVSSSKYQNQYAHAHTHICNSESCIVLFLLSN